jgi:hypothetical protein
MKEEFFFLSRARVGGGYRLQECHGRTHCHQEFKNFHFSSFHGYQRQPHLICFKEIIGPHTNAGLLKNPPRVI